MIAVFLSPWPLRGYEAADLWFFYKALSTLTEPVHFILSKEYFYPSSYWKERKRWEPKKHNQDKHGYSLPTQSQLEQCQFSLMDEGLFEKHLQQHANSTQFYNAWLTEDIPEITSHIRSILSDIPDLEAVLIWNNCASLNAAAKSLNIPVIHMEQGSLRSPEYASTFFFDFKGVNGSAEAEDRYYRAGPECKPLLSIDEMRTWFARDLNLSTTATEYDIGIALQVENDSNLVAYGNSFNNFTLLEHVRVKHANSNDKITVRPHPYALFTPNVKSSFNIDDSVNSTEFIARCNHILTINSSVGFEALLLGKEVTLLGEGPFKFIFASSNQDEMCRRLYFYLFAYLVPYGLLLDSDYLRFRLANPAETEIIKRHKEHYEKNN
jgi:capsule polysaccharide export protein KpsC/LpsZ